MELKDICTYAHVIINNRTYNTYVLIENTIPYKRDPGNNADIYSQDES